MPKNKCYCQEREWLFDLIFSDITTRKILKFKQKSAIKSHILTKILRTSESNPVARNFVNDLIEKKVLLKNGIANNKKHSFSYCLDVQRAYGYLLEDSHFDKMIEIEKRLNPPVLPI